MALVPDDLPRDPDQLLHRLWQMAEVVARQNTSLTSLQAEHDTVLADSEPPTPTERPFRKTLTVIRLSLRMGARPAPLASGPSSSSSSTGPQGAPHTGHRKS